MTGTCKPQQRILITACFADQSCFRIAPWVFFIETVLVCKYDHGIGINKICHQACQGIVITEADFISNHRIIFIHDWNHAQLQQRGQSRTSVQVAFAIGKVIVGKQDLRCVQVKLLKF